MGSAEASRNKRGNLPWLIALCFIGVAVLFRLAGQAVADPGRDLANEDAASQPGGVQVKKPVRAHGISLQSRSPAASGNINPDGYLRPGDDFAAIERRLAARTAYDDRALYVMRYAAAVCRTPLDAQWRAKARSDKGRVFSAWKETFCHGRTTATEYKTYVTTAMDAFRARHRDWDEHHPDEATHLFFDAALDSDLIEDASFAADMVGIPGSDGWDFGAEEVAGTPYLSKLPRYQKVALQGIQCGQVGGCGPDGLMTTWFCVTTPGSHCSPGTSVDDMWDDEFSTDEIAIIARIQQRILEERARRAEAQAAAGSL